jgi:hypothetical protein
MPEQGKQAIVMPAERAQAAKEDAPEREAKLPVTPPERAARIAEIVKQSFRDHEGSYRYLREK